MEPEDESKILALNFVEKSNPLCTSCKYFGVKKSNKIVDTMFKAMDAECATVIEFIEQHCGYVDVNTVKKCTEKIAYMYPAKDENGERPTCLFWQIEGTAPSETDLFCAFGLIGRYATACNGYEKIEVDIDGFFDLLGYEEPEKEEDIDLLGLIDQ